MLHKKTDILQIETALIMIDSNCQDLFSPNPYLICIKKQQQIWQRRQRITQEKKLFLIYQIFFCNVSLQGLHLVLCWITASHGDKFYISPKAIVCHQKSVPRAKHLHCIHEGLSPVCVYFLYLVDFSLLLSQGVLEPRCVHLWENTLSEHLHRIVRLVKRRTDMPTVSLVLC